MIVINMLKGALTRINHWLHPPRNYLALALRLTNAAVELQGRLKLSLGWHAYAGMSLGTLAYLADEAQLRLSDSQFFAGLSLEFLQDGLIRLVRLICIDIEGLDLQLSSKLEESIQANNELTAYGLKLVVINHILRSEYLYPQIRSLVVDVLRRKDVERQLREAIMVFFNSSYFQTMLATKTASLIRDPASQKAVSMLIRSEVVRFLSRKENIQLTKQYL